MQLSTRAARSAPRAWDTRRCPKRYNGLVIARWLVQAEQYSCHLQRRAFADVASDQASPQWRGPSKNDVVLNDLEATLAAHRKAIESLREDIRIRRVTSGNADDRGDGIEGIPLEDVLQIRRISNNTQTLEMRRNARNSRGEYVARVFRPTEMWRLGDILERTEGRLAHKYRPWLKDGAPSLEDAMAQLNREIFLFEDMMKFKKRERQGTQQCIHDISSLLKDNFPDHSMVKHGSHSTGLATPLSDIDICLSPPEMQQEKTKRGPSLTRPKKTKELDTLLNDVVRVVKADERFGLTFIVPARVPIVATVHKKTGCQIQLITGYPVTAASEYTSYYLAEHSEARQLFIVLSHALRIRNLTTVAEGGIGSYSIFMMVISFLKLAPPPPDLSQPIASRLLQFLEFWSSADTTNLGYAVDPARTFPKSSAKLEVPAFDLPYDEEARAGLAVIAEKNWRRPRAQGKDGLFDRPYLLCLQDPADYSNDLGRNTYSIKHIQKTFKRIHEHMSDALERWNAAEDDAARNGEQALLHYAVGANYAYFMQQREMLRAASPMWNQGKKVNKLNSKFAVFRPVLSDHKAVVQGLEGTKLGFEGYRNRVWYGKDVGGAALQTDAPLRRVLVTRRAEGKTGSRKRYRKETGEVKEPEAVV